MKNLRIFFIIIFVIFSNLFASVNFRVMTYNALNFDGTSRLSSFQTVFEQVDPDILICQEISSEAGSDALLSLLNTAIGGYLRANFVYNGDLNNMLFYKSSIASLISQDEITASPRDISEYVMNIAGNPIRFYSCHLKSSDGSTNVQTRLEAVTALRNHLNTLPEGTEFIITGDMNFYTSSELGYQKFIADEVVNIGRAKDLCSEVGNWHDNSSYSSVHTQSTRLTNFGGGASGGLDDRFDFIFSSYELNNNSEIEYVSDNYTIYGNDGNHFNQSINDPTNTAVPADVADALYYASDHLPVYADFVSLGFYSSQGDVIITEIMQNPNVVYDSNGEWFELFNNTDSAIDLNGWIIRDNGSDSHTIAGTLVIQPDDFLVLGNNSDSNTNGGYTCDYQYPGNWYLSNGDDEIVLLQGLLEIDRVEYDGGPNFPVPTGASMVFIGPYLNSDAYLQNDTGSNWLESTGTFGDGDKGSPGTLGNDATLPVVLSSFTVQYISNTPTLFWTTQSETENAGWNIYRGEDENAFSENEIITINSILIEGAGTTTQPTNYEYEDSYEIISGETYWYWLESCEYCGQTEIFDPLYLLIPSEGEAPQLPDKTLLFGNYPNPFNPDTNINFFVKENETAHLSIFNAKGQILITEIFEAGIYNYFWDASSFSSGQYFYRLESDSYSQVKKMTLIK